MAKITKILLLLVITASAEAKQPYGFTVKNGNIHVYNNSNGIVEFKVECNVKNKTYKAFYWEWSGLLLKGFDNWSEAPFENFDYRNCKFKVSVVDDYKK